MAPIDYSIKDVEKVVKHIDGRIKDVEVARLTAPGENYISLVLRVDFKVEKNGHTKTISTVAKRLTMGNSMHTEMSAQSMKNEIIWYTEIVSILTGFAEEYGIKMDIFPQYYGARCSLDTSKKDADGDSVLLLENLIPQGYKNEDRYIGFDLISAKAILKKLALFSALPIALKINRPDQFKVLKDLMDSFRRPGPPGPPPGHDGPPDHHGPPGHNGPPNGKRPEEMILEALHNIPDFAPYISRVTPILSKQHGPMHFDNMASEPWNTITHNDFWVNNVMIKPIENKEPLVKLVDFQTCLYGAFAKDIAFFLLTSVRNDVVKEHFDDLLRYYYDEFMAILNLTKTNLKLTYADYLEEVKNAANKTEVGHALFFSTIIFGEKGTGVDTAIEGFDPFSQMSNMINNMNQYQKDKLVVMACEATKRDWI